MSRFVQGGAVFHSSSIGLRQAKRIVGAAAVCFTTAWIFPLGTAAPPASATPPAQAVPKPAAANPPAAAETAAQRGYRTLRTKGFLPPDLTHEIFADLWTVWPDDLQAKAKAASPEERRKLLLSYYGLVEAEDGLGKTPLGYVDSPKGWVMNCLACHGGKVLGKTIPGLPNSHYGLHSLTEDVALVKSLKGIPLGHMELGSTAIPLGSTFGTTNAVVFGVALAAKRDVHLNVDKSLPTPKLVHHDLDAPPFWNVKKKSRLYYDGFVKKSHRSLMQFMMLPSNDGPTFRGFEEDYRDVLAWIESVEPPEYPFPVDAPLAEQGRAVFNRSCSGCHGTYGRDWTYPNKVVPLKEVGTDPVRWESLTPDYRRGFGRSWLGNYDEKNVVPEPVGYVAPPLDGIWASAPYLHNGSVPTLWHVLHPESRPQVWRRSEDGYDSAKVGLEVLETAPPTTDDRVERRRYFDSRKRGKSNAGHDFPNELSEDEKRSVLEYLKTL